MRRVAAVLALLITVSLPARCAHAQLPPGWTSGGLTATLPTAEAAPTPPTFAWLLSNRASLAAARTWVQAFSVPVWRFSTGRVARAPQPINVERRPVGAR
jgi:hypothetical protein